MSRKHHVIVRKNGRAYGTMECGSKSEAERLASQMRSTGTAGIEALVLGPARTENRRRRNPGDLESWRERLRALELAMRVRKIPRADQQSAALIALALQFVPPTDHLWFRPAPSATVPGAASNSDIVRALQVHGKGHEADVATGRASPREFDPVALAQAGIGQSHRRNPASFPAVRAGESAVDYGTRYAKLVTGFASDREAYAASTADGNAFHRAYFAGVDHHRATHGKTQGSPHTPTLRRGEAHSSWEQEMSGRDPLLHPSYYRQRNPAGRFPRSTEVQTLLFDKAMFNVTRAKEWAKAHGYRTSGTDLGGERAQMIRLRQVDPSKFTKGTFRTISFEPGIEAVIGMPKKGPASRGPRRNGKPSDVTLRAVGRYVKSVNPDEVEYAKGAGYGTGDLALGKYTYNIYGDAEAAWAELVAHVKASSPRRRRNPKTILGVYGSIRTKKPLDLPALNVVRGFISGDYSYRDLHSYLTERGFDPQPLHTKEQLADAKMAMRSLRANGKRVSGSTRPTRTSQVNAYLAAHGFPGITLHKGQGYLYFSGEPTLDWSETSVMVYRVSDLTLDGWMDHARSLAKTARRNPAKR